jgi:hypothetical protein
MFLPDDGIVMFFEAGDPDKTKSPPGIQTFRDEPMTRGATRFGAEMAPASRYLIVPDQSVPCFLLT